MLNEVNDHDGEQSGEAEGNPNMIEVVEYSLWDDGKYDSDRITANQEDLVNSEVETFVESGQKFTNSQCYCCDLALQLKCVERDIHEIQQLKNRAKTCDRSENTWVCDTNTCQSEEALLRSNLDKTNNTANDLKAKIMYLEQKKYNLVTFTTLQLW